MRLVLMQMAALIACGVIWRIILLLVLVFVCVCFVFFGLVFFLLMPALVLLVLWRAPLTWDALRIAAAAASGVLVASAVAAGVYRAWHTSKAKIGALILAAAFPNVTYLGLPVLEKTFGPWARSVAIQYDLFACTPLLLTLGILLAQTHGTRDRPEPLLIDLFKVPPLWAAAP